MMNRALKQQATELEPNMWQQQQEIAKYDKKFDIFLFHHHNKLPVGQQHCWYMTRPKAASPIYSYFSPSLPQGSDCISLTHILWVLGVLTACKGDQGRKLFTNHIK
jgi:hypothetical protein